MCHASQAPPPGTLTRTKCSYYERKKGCSPVGEAPACRIIVLLCTEDVPAIPIARAFSICGPYDRTAPVSRCVAGMLGSYYCYCSKQSTLL